MASMAMRRLALGNHASALRRPLGAAAAVRPRRSLNTSAEMARVDDRHPDLDDRSDRPPVSRRRDFPFFSDVFDPFGTTRSVSQLVNLMDQLMESPAASRGRGIGIGGGGAIRRGWDIREDDDALRLKVDMPGLGKEDVKVSVEDNTLIIKGEEAGADADADADANKVQEDQDRRRYSSRIDLTPNMYRIDGIQAEMKNGVLKLTVPKLQEDHKDVFQVAVH